MEEQGNKDKPPEAHTSDMVIDQTAKIIDAIQTARKSRLVVLISHKQLNIWVALYLNSMIRKMCVKEDLEAIDVLLDSAGGDIDSAYKVSQILKSYAKRVTVIVPFYAKSAATLIALGADRLQMCRGGELGPVDPQVWDPDSGAHVPALSLKNAMDFINEADNPITAVSLATKISPLLIGSYRNAEATSRQYLNEIFTAKGMDGDKRDDLVDVFTKQLLSHGFPMSQDFLTRHGVAVDSLDKNEENMFADLHEMWSEYCLGMYAADPEQEGHALVLQSSEKTFIMLGDAIVIDT